MCGLLPRERDGSGGGSSSGMRDPFSKCTLPPFPSPVFESGLFLVSFLFVVPKICTYPCLFYFSIHVKLGGWERQEKKKVVCAGGKKNRLRTCPSRNPSPLYGRLGVVLTYGCVGSETTRICPSLFLHLASPHTNCTARALLLR